MGRKQILVWVSLLLALAVPHARAQSPDAQILYTKIYCPLCGGVRLDVCELKVCEDMRLVVQQRLAAGESEEQIIGYFRRQYGDQVLGYPPAEGFNWAAWILPFAGVIGAALALWWVARGWTRAAANTRGSSQMAVPADLAARIEREIQE